MLTTNLYQARYKPFVYSQSPKALRIVNSETSTSTIQSFQNLEFLFSLSITVHLRDDVILGIFLRLKSGPNTGNLV